MCKVVVEALDVRWYDDHGPGGLNTSPWLPMHQLPSCGCHLRIHKVDKGKPDVVGRARAERQVHKINGRLVDVLRNLGDQGSSCVPARQAAEHERGELLIRHTEVTL